jgi:glycosyltransferase involved in cell wall biosynthesis
VHKYNFWIKDQIEELSYFFKYTNVLVRHNYLAQIGNIFNLEAVKPFTLDVVVNKSNLPPNTNVILSSIFYLPGDKFYKTVGFQHYKKVEKIIRKNMIHFDLIHSHFIWSSGYVGMLLKEKYNVPLIITAHGYDVYDLPFRDDEWANRIKTILNNSDYITTVSQSNLTCLNRLNIKTPIKVILNGFNQKLFYPRDKYECRKILNLPFDKKIVLNVGGIVGIKGQIYLIESFEKIVQKQNDVICYIIGDGELKNDLKREVSKRGLSKYIKFLGARPHDEIPLWMNAADIFVLPSLNEGNPGVMFECLGCGKPFVGSKVGGIPDIIKSDKYGLLTQPGNSMDLYEKIMNALSIKWDYDEILNYSRKFSWNVIINEYLDIYNKVIN